MADLLKLADEMKFSKKFEKVGRAWFARCALQEHPTFMLRSLEPTHGQLVDLDECCLVHCRFLWARGKVPRLSGC